MWRLEVENCVLCGKRFKPAIRRRMVTIALRTTVLPMLVGAAVLCLWLLFAEVGPAQIFLSGMR
jgi:hypothetical protein